MLCLKYTYTWYQDMNILLVALMILAPITAISDDNTIHIQEGGDITKEQLSQLKMQRNLIDTAKKYKQYGEIARASHHDMAFPRDRDEYIGMNGYGILWVTSHSQIKAELPIKNLRIDIWGMKEIVLEPVYSFLSNESQQLVSTVLGKYRTDSIYMIPLFKEMQGAKLVADYAINRSDFLLGNIANEFPSEIGDPLPIPKHTELPDKERFHTMLEREYPIAKNLIEKKE